MITGFAVLAENTNVNVIKNSQWFSGCAHWRAVSLYSIFVKVQRHIKYIGVGKLPQLTFDVAVHLIFFLFIVALEPHVPSSNPQGYFSVVRRASYISESGAAGFNSITAVHTPYPIRQRNGIAV